MKPLQSAIILNSLLFALALLCVAALTSPLDGYVLAADKPAKEQIKVQNNSGNGGARRDDRGTTASTESDNQGKNRGESGKPSQSKAEPDRPPENNGANRSKPDEPPKAASPAVTQSSPTASPVPRTSVSSILVGDQCGVSGDISFSGGYTGSLTLLLTYHVTGDSEFYSTGVTWNHTFSGQTSASYTLPLSSPPSPPDGSDGWVNTYRVEILSADPPLTNMTAKSESFDCDNWTGRPTVTVAGTPTVPVSATVTASVLSTVAASSTPQVVPSATVSPSSTIIPVPSETPAPTATEEPTPTATTEPTPTATASPMPSPSATMLPRYGTQISPGYITKADPGTEVSYAHIITNTGSVPDVKAIRVESSLHWTVSVLIGGSNMPVSDNDHDGFPDIGPLAPGESMDVTIRLKVPDDALRASSDVTTVTAFSNSNPARDDAATATDTTTVNGVITVSLSTDNVSFGDVSPLGSLALGVPNLSSTSDDLGAYYTRSGAVQVTVNSNSAWTGTLSARENDGSARTIRIADGDLDWQLPGGQDWTSFGTAASGFTSGSPGTSSLTSDYRLRVLWDDDPGTFSTVVIYDVTQ